MCCSLQWVDLLDFSCGLIKLGWTRGSLLQKKWVSRVTYFGLKCITCVVNKFNCSPFEVNAVFLSDKRWSSWFWFWTFLITYHFYANVYVLGCYNPSAVNWSHMHMKNYLVVLGTATWCPNTLIHHTFFIWKYVLNKGVWAPRSGTPTPLNNYSMHTHAHTNSAVVVSLLINLIFNFYGKWWNLCPLAKRVTYITSRALASLMTELD